MALNAAQETSIVSAVSFLLTAFSQARPEHTSTANQLLSDITTAGEGVAIGASGFTGTTATNVQTQATVAAEVAAIIQAAEAISPTTTSATAPTTSK